MRFPVDRKPERAVQAKIRDKKKYMKKLAEIVRNSGKNERLDEPKTRKGGSWKNEIETRGKCDIHDTSSTEMPGNDGIIPSRVFRDSIPSKMHSYLPSAMVPIRLPTTLSPKRISRNV
ncbi:hypothetical protein MTR_3g047635 [Medicago truncatula]|uniref:Uncharacterized protein n=1 Tax=Medicago truncatula TaxID=3880 RepID=A0A072V5W2_MEDTR|nr:hypothetical protein MTR_3g047635 [Medicago truncatula]